MTRTERFAKWLRLRLEKLSRSAYVPDAERMELMRLRDTLNDRFPP